MFFLDQTDIMKTIGEINRGCTKYEEMTEKYKTNEDVFIAFIRRDKENLCKLFQDPIAERFRDNLKVMVAAIAVNPYCFYFASEELKKNPSFKDLILKKKTCSPNPNRKEFTIIY